MSIGPQNQHHEPSANATPPPSAQSAAATLRPAPVLYEGEQMREDSLWIHTDSETVALINFFRFLKLLNENNLVQEWLNVFEPGMTINDTIPHLNINMQLAIDLADTGNQPLSPQQAIVIIRSIPQFIGGDATADLQFIVARLCLSMFSH